MVNPGPRGYPVETKSLWTDLAAKAKDALDIAGKTALALLLHLVIQRREGHMVESKVKEQGFAGDWLEVRRELDQIGLLSHEGGVKAEGLQAVAEGRVVFHLLLRRNFSGLVSV